MADRPMHPFSVDHLLSALSFNLAPDDAASVVTEAKRIAETRKVRLGDIREGDFARISWYLPKREAYVSGVCRVVKVDGQGLHLEVHSGFGNHSFGDGETDLSLMKGIGPLSARRARKLVKEAWRISPYVPVEGCLHRPHRH